MTKKGEKSRHYNDKESEKTPTPCIDCPYGRTYEFCFPCMKDILGREGIKAWQKSQGLL